MSDQPSMRLSDIRKGERYRRDLGDIEGLAASIATVGLLHPVVVTSEGLLVAGERRLAAVSRLGWVRVPVRVIDPAVLLMAEQDENAQRLPFSPSEAAAIAKALMPIAKAAAKERMEAGGPSAETAKGRAADQVAAAVGMHRDTLAKATYVVEAATADPTLAPIVEAMDTTGNVEAAHRETRRRLDSAAERIREDDPLAAEAHRVAGFSRAINRFGKGLVALDADLWADGLNANDTATMGGELVIVRQWLAKWQKALDRPALRVVGGDL